MPSVTFSLDYETLNKVRIFMDNEMLGSMSEAIRMLVISGLNYQIMQKKQKREAEADKAKR